MKRSVLIANRLREVLLDGDWVANTNFKKEIKSITWEQAIEKVGELNTIALLTFHISYYVKGVLNVFEGGGLEIRDKYSFEMPPIQSDNDWEKLVCEFLKTAEQLIVEIGKIPDSKLEEVFVDEKYGTYLRNIEVMIEHFYYHLGQISLIKKLILESRDN